MGGEPDRFELLRRLARRYVWDGLGLWEALDEALRLDPVSGIQTFKSSALYQFEKALAVARAENRALRARVDEMERQLDPFADEREIQSRLARERERREEEEREWNAAS
jgi:hypothetical protein